MEIVSITLINFKSYYGENTIDFTSGLNVISGRIGTGKTSLFDAFSWVLLEAVTNSNERHDVSFVNAKYVSENLNNEDLTTGVRLVIKDHSKKGSVANEISFNKYFVFNTADGKIKYSKKQLSYSYIDEETRNHFESHLRNEFIDKLHSIIGVKLLSYILFKGENVEQLISFDKEDTLVTAVDSISYYRYYVALKEHLAVFKKVSGQKLAVKTKERSKNNRQLLEANHTIQTCTDQLEKKTNKLKELEIELNDLIETRDNLFGQLELISGIPEINSEIAKVDLERKSALEKKEQLYNFGKKRLLDNWIFLRGSKLLQQYEQEKEKFIKLRDKEIKDINTRLEIGVPGDALIDRMIDKCQCLICGTAFEKGSKQENLILSHKDKNKQRIRISPEHQMLSDIFGNFNSEIARRKFNIDNIKKEFIQHRSDYESVTDEILQIIDSLNKLKDRKEQILRSKNLTESELLGIGGVATRTKTLEGRVKTTELHISRTKEEITDLKNRLIKAKSTRNTLLGSESEDTLKETVLDDFADALYDAMDSLVVDERVRILKSIEAESNRIIAEIIDASRHLNNIVTVNVKIDTSTCKISFVDINDNITIPHGAQSKLAKLSVISAILKMTSDYLGKDYTFIVDAPSSEFDDSIYEHYLRSTSLNFNQSIVILKDIHKDLEKYRNADFISNLIMLEKNETNNQATMDTSHTVINSI